MTHQEIVELMQTTLGHEIDDRIAGVQNRRSMLHEIKTPALQILLNWVGSFHPGQIYP